jgi:hypothetical protein
MVDDNYLLKKFPGKGGWVYAEIPEIKQNPNNPFGWVTVRGNIDGLALKHYKLMPMGNGRLFLPVKAAIRKKIGKDVGEMVHIVLKIDETPVETPQEVIECFDHEPPSVYKKYEALTDNQKKTYLDWIYAARTDETKAKRILKMIDQLSSKD